jgi:hypothetical protein
MVQEVPGSIPYYPDKLRNHRVLSEDIGRSLKHHILSAPQHTMETRVPDYTVHASAVSCEHAVELGFLLSWHGQSAIAV